MWWKILKKILQALPLGVLVTVFIAGGSVSPDTAVSNYAKWADRIGIHGVATWLTAKSTNQVVMSAIVIVAVIYSAAVWGLPIIKKWRHENGNDEVAFDEAARSVYEAMERTGNDPMTEGGFSSSSVPLDHFKYVLLSAHKRGTITLYGAREPSRQSIPIPRDLIAQLMPSRNDPNGISSISRSSPIDFRRVWLSRRDVHHAITYRSRLLENTNKGLAVQSEAEPDRISARALLDLAVERGWPENMSDVRWLGFFSELRQAAADARIAIWGRDELRNASAPYGKRHMVEPLLAIPPDNWKTFEIEPSSFLASKGGTTRTYDKHRKDWGYGNRYVDLHFGKEAVNLWLSKLTVPR